MLHKIREYMECENKQVLNDEVEIDETFVGGKNKNRHKDKKVEKCQGRSFKGKVPVFGMYQRGGSIVAKTVTDTRAKTLSPLIDKHISNGSKVFIDGWDYGGLNANYEQHSVGHSIGFMESIVDDDSVITNVCTNGFECAWSQLKRTIFGTYYKVGKKYLQRYIDEFAFRFNTRKLGDNERFELFLRNIA